MPGGEGAFFESFVVQDISARLPVQQLHQRAATVEKYKDLSAGRIAPQPRADQPGQSVEAFAHIADPAVQVVVVGGA